MLRTLHHLKFLLSIILLFFSGCLSSGADIQASLPGADGDLTISGQIGGNASSLSISSARYAETDDEESESTTRVRIFTIEGERLGTGTTESDGSFSLGVDLDVLRGGEDSGDAFSETIIVTAPDQGLENVYQLDYSSGTEDVDTGNTDADTTLAAQVFARQMDGFTTWGIAYDSQVTSANIECADVLFETLWEQSEEYEDDTVGSLLKIFRDVFTGLINAGTDFEQWGYTSAAEFLEAIFNGTVASTDGLWEDIVTAAAEGNPDLDTETALALFDSGVVDGMDAIGSVLLSSVGGGSSDTPGLVLYLENAAESICETLSETASDTTEIDDAFVEILAGAEESDQLTDAFSDTDTIAVLAELLQRCEDSGSCEESINERASAYLGFFLGLGGNLDSIVDPDSGEIIDGALDVIETVAEYCDETAASSSIDCAQAMEGVITTAGVDDFLDSNGDPDTTEISAWSSYWTANQDFDADLLDDSYYEDVYTTNSTFFDSASAQNYISCTDAATTTEELNDCYNDYNLTPPTEADGYEDSSGSSASGSSGSGSSSSSSSSYANITNSNWISVIGDGFYNASGNTWRASAITTLEAYSGALYAATSHGTLKARLWKYFGGSWSDLNVHGALLTDEMMITTLVQDTSGLFFGTRNFAGNASVFYSTDGSSFTEISTSPKLYSETNNISISAMAIFTNSSSTKHLYIGTKNSSGAQIWRIGFPINSSNWSKVADFSNSDGDNINLAGTIAITSFLAGNDGKIYAGFNSGTGGMIYTSTTGDSNSWSLLASSYYGANNIDITSMLNHGGKIYFGTENTSTGAEIWEFNFGSNTWNKVANFGLGDSTNTAVTSMLTGPDSGLWATTANASGSKTYRSFDLSLFSIINVSGFGNGNTGVPGGTLETFGGSVYWSGKNDADGGKIFRVNPSSP